jgi:hypothetical protein
MDKKLLHELTATDPKLLFWRMFESLGTFRECLALYAAGELENSGEVAILDEELNGGQPITGGSKIEALLELFYANFFTIPQSPLQLTLQALLSSKRQSLFIEPLSAKNIFRLCRMLKKVQPKFLMRPTTNSFSLDVKRLNWTKGGFGAYFSGIQFEAIVNSFNSAKREL